MSTKYNKIEENLNDFIKKSNKRKEEIISKDKNKIQSLKLEDLSDIKKLIFDIETLIIAKPFLIPIKWTLSSIDYNKYISKIKEPVDLYTIKTRIKNNFYKSKEECIFEIYKIWDNCISYNKSSPINKRYAINLKEITDIFLNNELLKKKRSFEDRNNNIENNKIGLINKCELSYQINNLSNDLLIKLVTYCNSKYKHLLFESNEEIFFQIDKITKEEYDDINQYINKY